MSLSNTSLTMIGVIFEPGAYLTSIKANGSIQSEEAIVRHAIAHPAFYYPGWGNEGKFREIYSSKGWQGRKLWAIPTGAYYLLNGSVRVLHLVALSFLCLPRMEVGRQWKYAAFGTYRHLQLGYGHLASLVNDRYGLYRVEEAKFYLTCYKCWGFDVVMYKQPDGTHLMLDKWGPVSEKIRALQLSKIESIAQEVVRTVETHLLEGRNSGKFSQDQRTVLKQRMPSMLRPIIEQLKQAFAQPGDVIEKGVRFSLPDLTDPLVVGFLYYGRERVSVPDWLVVTLKVDPLHRDDVGPQVHFELGGSVNGEEIGRQSVSV